MTSRTTACQPSLSVTKSWSLLKLMSVMPPNHLILCHPLIFLSLIFLSIRVFSNESVIRITWPKYWNFSFSVSLSSEYSGLISFRMDWLDLLAVQGTLKSLLQHHSSEVSVLQCSAFLRWFVFSEGANSPVTERSSTVYTSWWQWSATIVSSVRPLPIVSEKSLWSRFIGSENRHGTLDKL